MRRVLLVGSGFVAPFHLAGWARVADARVVAIASTDRPSAEALATRFAVPAVFGSIEEALETARPDVVDVCSPVTAHPAHVRAAFAAGADVICQKPLAEDLATALALADAARQAGRRLMVHENFRFRPWYRLLRRIIDDGRIGTPTFLRSSCRLAGTVRSPEHPDIPWSIARQPYFADLEPFLLIESAIHQIDVARFLLGDPEVVFARTRRVSPLVRGEDMVTVLLGFPGAEAVIERSYASLGHQPPPHASEEVLIEGTAGAARVSLEGQVSVVEEAPGHRRVETVDPAGPSAYADSYAATIAHFAECLRSGARFETDVEDNLRTLDAVFGAYRSAASGDSVRLPMPEREDRHEAACPSR